MSTPYWLASDKKIKIDCDVLIVGGGISGIGLAYWIQKLSRKKVILVEKNRLGTGATGRNAGFISTGSLTAFKNDVETFGVDKALEIKNFCRRNNELLKMEIIDQSPTDLFYKKSGSMTLLLKEKDMVLNDFLEPLNKAGFKYSLKDKEYVKNYMGMTGAIGGVLDEEDGQIHSYKLLSAISKKLKSRLLAHQEIYKVENGIALTNDYEINFTDVVYAINGYTSSLIPSLSGIISPIRGQIIVKKTEENLLEHNGYDSDSLSYFRQIPDVGVLVGGFRKIDEKKEVGFSDVETTEKVQNALKSFISLNWPKLASAPVDYQWSGIMGSSVDGNPVVGELKKNQFIIGGYSGHGMGKAFACSESLASLIVNGVNLPDFIDVKRFKSSLSFKTLAK